MHQWHSVLKYVTACLAFISITFWICFVIRKRQLASRISRLLDERLAERTRVASDLQDSFLQTVEACRLLVENILSKSSNVDEMRTTLQRLSDWLGQAASEGSIVLESLRMSKSPRNDLADAFLRATESELVPDTLEVKFSLIGQPKEMHPIVRDEVYRIGYEAMTNAYAHSRATRMTVDLEYGKDLSLRIFDNGIGISQSILEPAGASLAGLQMMRERAIGIGGRLRVTTSPSIGTEVRLLVPGFAIFRDLSPSRQRTAEHRKGDGGSGGM